MTLFSTIKRGASFEGTLPLTASTLASLFSGGKSASGMVVNRDTAAGLTAMYRAWSVLSSTLAGSPLVVTDDVTHEAVENKLLNAPHDMFTTYEFFELIILHLMSNGNHYSLMNGGRPRRLGGEITSLFPLDPTKVTPKFSYLSDGKTPFERVYEVVLKDGEKVVFDDSQIWHVPGMSFDGLKGMSLIGVAKEMLGGSMAAEMYASKLFGSGSLMSGILTTDKRLSDEQASALKQRWQSKIAGINNAHEVTVLDSGASFNSLTINPNEAQFIEARQFGVHEVSRMTGVPPHILMADQSLSTNSTGIEQENIGFVLFTLRGWSKKIEGRIKKDLLPQGQSCEFSLRDFQRGDTKTRAAAHLLMRKASAVCVNDMRQTEGLPLIDDPRAYDVFHPLTGSAADISGGIDEGGDTTDQGGSDGDAF